MVIYPEKKLCEEAMLGVSAYVVFPGCKEVINSLAPFTGRRSRLTLYCASKLRYKRDQKQRQMCSGLAKEGAQASTDSKMGRVPTVSQCRSIFFFIDSKFFSSFVAWVRHSGTESFACSTRHDSFVCSNAYKVDFCIGLRFGFSYIVYYEQFCTVPRMTLLVSPIMS